MNNFKWYRKLRGGTWQYVNLIKKDWEGINHNEKHWIRNMSSQQSRSDITILKTENYGTFKN